MTANIESANQQEESFGRGFNWQIFLQDNLTGSWYQIVLVTIMALVTGFYAKGKYEELPTLTMVVLIAWFIGIILVVIGELRHHHTAFGRWLKANLFSSISNTLLTLLITLILTSAIQGIYQWGFVNATFDPEKTLPEFRPEDGATWGVIVGARKLLMTGLLEPIYTWRVWLSIGFIAVMWLLTYVSSRPAIKDKLRTVRQIINGFWLLSPIILYIFLAGMPAKEYDMRGALTGMAVVLALYILLWWQKVIFFNWVSLAAQAHPMTAMVKIRYRSPAALATVCPEGEKLERARVVFDEPIRAITRGQAAAAYDPEEPGRLILGGWIE